MESSKILTQNTRYEKLRGIGIFLIGVSSAIMAVTLLGLVNQNNELDHRIECRAEIRDELDAAIARGLVAVASEDPEQLQYQVEIILEVTEQLGDC